MPLSTDINLPRDHEPAWPSRCVCCGEDNPDSSLRFRTSSIGWWTFVFWMGGSGFTTHVPVCEPCEKSMRNTRALRLFLTWGMAFAGVAVAFWILRSYDGPLKKWIAMLITIVCMLPYFFWETVFPPAFDITCYSKTVDYEFRDEAYAIEFIELNIEYLEDDEADED